MEVPSLDKEDLIIKYEISVFDSKIVCQEWRPSCFRWSKINSDSLRNHKNVEAGCRKILIHWISVPTKGLYIWLLSDFSP